jgi:hypothetical protein
LVLVAIAHHADRFGCNAYPSLTTLGEETRLTRRQVMRCVEQLEALGELQCATRAAPGQANLYAIPLVDNSVDNQAASSPVVTPTSPSNKEGEAAVVTFEAAGGDISDTQVVTPMSPKHTVKHPEDFKDEDEEARARDGKFSGPITKAHSARRAAHPPGEQPKEAAPPPDFPLPDGLERLADFEALRADPLLLAVARAWVDLQGRSLETLTKAEGEALAAKQAEWGGRFTPDDIRKAKQETTLRKAMVQHMYFLAVLDAWAKKPPGNGNGNGHARARAAPANGHGAAAYNGLDPKEYMEPGGKYTAMFNPAVVPRRVVKTGGGSGGS